jgi:hypothetical protein
MAYVFTNVTQATRRQRTRLRDAILIENNLIDSDSLNLLLRDIGNTTLERVAEKGNLEDQFADALDWLSDQKLIGKFCIEVVKRWPYREDELSKLFDKILSDTATVQGGPLHDQKHLFDRVNQETMFTTAICRTLPNVPQPPVVVMISGVADDDVNLMLERIVKVSILDCELPPPQKGTPYPLVMETAVSASGLFRQLAKWVLGQVSLRERVEDLLPKVQTRIAGQMFAMRLGSDMVTAETGKVFAEFFDYWSQLGSHPQPPFLFLLIVNEEAGSSAAPVISPAAWYDMIGEACRPYTAKLMLMDHLVLTMCRPDDISNWIDSLSAIQTDPDFDDLLKRARTVFGRSSLLQARQPFRLRQFTTVLDEKL